MKFVICVETRIAGRTADTPRRLPQSRGVSKICFANNIRFSGHWRQPCQLLLCDSLPHL
jgi:hypothetical protein